MIIAPPNPESREIAGALTDLEVRMRRAEAGLRAAQLKNSSITNGGVNIYDGDGRLRGVVGRNPDGTYAPTSTNNPDPPPVPASPIVTAALASLIVRHNGETQSGVQFPSDFSHLNIYYALEQNPDEWTNGGSLLKLPDELPIAPLEYTSYLVAVTAVNLSGKESEKSVPSSGSPNQVVPNDLIEDILADLELSAGSVTEAALAAGAVTETKIAPDSISSPKVIAGAILGVHILADQIDGGKLIAQAITSREIQALAVIAGKIDVNAVTAGTIAVGAVTAVKLEANLIISSRFIAGSATGNRVEMHPTQGLQAYTNGGAVRSFWIDAGTGSALLIGEIRSAASGTRIIINPGGNQPDRIQFWPDAAGGSVDYAYIDSFPEGAVDTGITMQASGGATNRVGTIWLRRAYAALGIADNGLVANSHFYAEPNFVRCRSATVDLIVDQAVAPLNGPRRVAILNYNTAGQPVVLIVQSTTSRQRPTSTLCCSLHHSEWESSGTVEGISLSSMVILLLMTGVPIEASQFRLASDSRMKSDVSDFEWSALDTVQQSPAKKWKRRNMGVRTAPQDDPMFASATTRSLREEPWLFGPMADDLPPDLIHTDADSGMRKIELGSMIGVLWKAVEELSAKVKELEDVNP
jgi:hypothetical protein